MLILQGKGLEGQTAGGGAGDQRFERTFIRLALEWIESYALVSTASIRESTMTAAG